MSLNVQVHGEYLEPELIDRGVLVLNYSNDVICHTVSNWVEVPASVAFAYVTDGVRQGEWTLGSFNRGVAGESTEGTVYVGRSMMDGRACYVRPRRFGDDLFAFYDVGFEPDKLTPGEVVIRVLPGENWGGTPSQCIITISIWRAKGVSDIEWAQECQMFNAEIFIVKGRLESQFDPFEPIAGATYG